MKNINNRFDIGKPIVENLIEECNHGEFKLPDHIFAQACEEHKMEEEAVMQLMTEVDKSRGEFVRVPDGWIFIDK